MLFRSVSQSRYGDVKYLHSKYKTPYQYVISSVRASGVPLEDTYLLMDQLRAMGEPTYSCETPNGYKFIKAAWLNPGGLDRRINFAMNLGNGTLPIYMQQHYLIRYRIDLDEDPPKSETQVALEKYYKFRKLDPQQLLSTMGYPLSVKTQQVISTQTDPGLS